MVKTPIRLYPKKGFCPSLKIYRGDFIHLVKKDRGDFILVSKNMGGGGIKSTYKKMTRGDSIRAGGGGGWILSVSLPDYVEHANQWILIIILINLISHFSNIGKQWGCNMLDIVACIKLTQKMSDDNVAVQWRMV